MVYEVPDPKKSIAQNKFEFSVGGKKYWLPRAKFLSGRQIGMLREDDGPVEVFTAIAPDTRTRDAILEIPVNDLEGLMTAWNEDSGVTLPELADSAG